MEKSMQKSPSLFEMELTRVKGVGEKRAALLQKLGIRSVGELIYLFPRTYEDWTPVPLQNAPVNEVCTVLARVTLPPREQRIRKGMTLYKVSATDDVCDLLLTFFNNPYVKNMLEEGKEYLFRGKVTGNLLRKEMTSPAFLPVEKEQPLLPIYRQTEGLPSRQISSSVKNALELLPEQLNDPLPEEIRQRYTLCSLRYALDNIHFPADSDALEIARRRLIFEELLLLQLGLLHIRSLQDTGRRGPVMEKDYSKEFEKLLPYTLTGAQKRAIAEAMRDLRSGARPMNRLVQGDVGSGKTAVAASLCYTAAKNGFQAAFMAPTEILAAQHYQSLSRLLAPAGITVALLTGSLSAAAKREVLSRLKEGSIDLLIGTHALISENVTFAKLGLVITDEQHRFGVKQRTLLAEKGSDPHFLVMSATPIPRTLALMLYGDLDISLLDELPPGRQKIDTFHIDSAKRARAYGYVRKQLDAGRQGYLICPLVDGDESSDMLSVTQYTKELQIGEFAGYRVGMLHGKMKPAEKDAVMRDFKNGVYQLLVSTTVVEVGVDVPNAVIILIENAERYGLSQLHQLRGRVGRGAYKSTCILVSDAQNDEALARFRVMCETNDGFRIANEDLKLRGPGDFFGTQQHGLPQLQIADMLRDMETLRQAQACAQQLYRDDPTLSSAAHRGLRAQVRRLFARNSSTGVLFG